MTTQSGRVVPSPGKEIEQTTQRPVQLPLGTSYFVERKIYKRRRMVDAARALPVLAGLLWAVPLLWSEDLGITASKALIYLFLTWAGLSAATGVFIALIRRHSAPDRPEARR